MHTYVLQDWTTVQANVTTITQSEAGWLDLTGYQDAVFYVEIGSATSFPTLNLQTAPTADESLFVSMTSGTTMLGSSTPAVVPVFMKPSPTPIARYVRWQITGSPSWNATFRITVAANSPGM